MLYNLLFNALDAQPTGGRIGVVVERDDSGRSVVIRVEDDGPGLLPQVRDRVFEPFVSTKEAGMGLGLSICRRIVESHGGEIGIDDSEGCGSTLSVRMPLSQPSRQDCEPDAIPAATLS